MQNKWTQPTVLGFGSKMFRSECKYTSEAKCRRWGHLLFFLVIKHWELIMKTQWICHGHLMKERPTSLSVLASIIFRFLTNFLSYNLNSSQELSGTNRTNVVFSIYTLPVLPQASQTTCGKASDHKQGRDRPKDTELHMCT